MPDVPVIYSIEFGATRTTAGFTVNGTTTAAADLQTPQGRRDGPVALLACAVELVAQVAKVAPPMDAVSVSFSSFLDIREQPGARSYGPLRDREILVTAPHIGGIVNLPFFQWLGEAGWHVPLHVENDVNAALRAIEHHPTALGVNMGTGLAAAIKRNNTIVHMPNTWSCYQIGHSYRFAMPDDMLRKCSCGSIGCLEAAIGAWGLGQRYGVRPEVASGDVYAQMAQDVVTHLGLAIVELIEKSGIDLVILTGRAARGFEAGASLTSRLSNQIALMRPTWAPPRLEVIDHGRNAGLHGAALAALDYDICGVGSAH